jgi:uncharacterized protein (DUF885 family)
MTMTPTRALICLLAASACTPQPSIAPAPDQRGATAARQVIAIADDYFAAWREAFPEVNTTSGFPGARHDRLTDNSASGEKAWQAKEDRWLSQMRGIDSVALIGRPEWVTYGLLREELEASTGMRACNSRVWNVSPMIGFLAGYAPLAQQQPVGTEELRAQALARWRTFPHFVDTEIENLREGVRPLHRAQGECDARHRVGGQSSRNDTHGVSLLRSRESGFDSRVPPGIRAARR